MMQYWNARAVALFQHKELDFVMGSAISGLLGCFDARVKNDLQSIEEQQKRFEMAQCLDCAQPAEHSKGAWHLITDMILAETSKVIHGITTGSPSVKQSDMSLSLTDRIAAHLQNSGNVRTAVAYFSCETECPSTQKSCTLGLVPHHFVRERLPSTVNRVLIIANKESFATGTTCARSLDDLKKFLEVERADQNLEVTLRQVGELGSIQEAEDWLTLAVANVLFCWPSTFCASAALGNPNAAFVAVNQEHAAVAGPWKEWSSPSHPLGRPSLRWEEMDMLPFDPQKNPSWRKVQIFLRSSTCEPFEWDKHGNTQGNKDLELKDCHATGENVQSIWYGAPLGNCLHDLWSNRLKKAFDGGSLALMNPTEKHPVLRYMGMRWPKYEPSEEQLEMFKIAKKTHCGWGGCMHFFAHDLIIRETQKITQLMVKHVQKSIPLSEDRCTAVVHIRCGADTMRAPDYGLTPHRFVLKNLPPHITKVVMVGTPYALGQGDGGASFDSNARPPNYCGAAAKDLQAQLEETRRVTVTLRYKGEQIDDWLFLATAPMLFCWTSTFCSTAALGNPNTVFIAVNGLRMSVVAPPKAFGDRNVPPIGRPGLHWVDMDMLITPIPKKYKKSIDEFLLYMRSDSCHANYSCVNP